MRNFSKNKKKSAKIRKDTMLTEKKRISTGKYMYVSKYFPHYLAKAKKKNEMYEQKKFCNLTFLTL